MRRIALVAPETGDHIHRLVDGVLRYQAERGNFLLTDYRFDDELIEQIAASGDEPSWSHQVEGVIASVGPQPGVGQWLRRSRVPVVNTSADRVGSGLIAIHTDAASVARVAADHFQGLGIREFAHAGHAASPGSMYREQACQAEFQQRDLPLQCWRLNSALNSHLPAETDALLQAEPQLVEALRQAAKPLGVLAIADSYAAAVLQVCAHLNLRVPDEVAILGVGDTALARKVTPQLSSICVPREQIGYEAMALLDRLMSGDQTVPLDSSLPVTEISIRGSTSTEPNQDRDIERALRMIREQACLGLDVGDVLETLNLSRKTFERRFVEAIGHPPGEEIRRVRLERARELLRTTELSVTRVGRMVGFDRGSMFTRFFKTQTGQTPRDYRRDNEMTAS